MDLVDSTEIVPVEVVRNARFGTLGSVLHDRADMLAFVESEAFLQRAIQNPKISALIVPSQLSDRVPDSVGIAVSDNPRRDFYTLHNHLANHTAFYGGDFDTVIDETANVSPSAIVAESNVRIGPGCVVGPLVVLHERTILGEKVMIGAGSVIGSNGYEFKRFGDSVMPIAHSGGVRLGNRVEIQANSCVDRAVFGGFTEIDDDCKIDNLVHVAHNVRIGTRTFVVAHAMLGGSAVIGNDVWIGPGALVSNDVSIGDRASITLGAVVTRDVASDSRVSGNFAVDHGRFLAHIKSIR